MIGVYDGHKITMFKQNPRAELYQTLAESLVEPPPWLANPGREWPLFRAAIRVGKSSPAARRGAVSLAEIGSESLRKRIARYKEVFEGSGRPRFWLYESIHRSGRIFGPEALAVEQVYKATGVETDPAILPDHASV